MTKDQIFEFFRRLAEDNPSPETELEFGNPYQLVVAVALSAQATDVSVNKATRALFETVKTPQQMVELAQLLRRARVLVAQPLERDAGTTLRRPGATCHLR